MAGYVKDITGERYGRLVVLKLSHVKRGAWWVCRCDCGNKKIAKAARLRNGQCKSCGCLKEETYAVNGRLGGIVIEHGEACNRTGKATKEYRAWQHMKARCCTPTNDRYADYGGRGIRVCKRWLEGYENFLADVGRAPAPEYSIDRIDVNGNYEPSNVRWATPKVQANNRRVMNHAFKQN